MEDCLFVSPAGREYCYSENVDKDTSCRVGRESGGRFQIRVERDTCLLDILDVGDSDFGSWSCLGNHWDNWGNGTVRLHPFEEAQEIEIVDKLGGNALFGDVLVEAGELFEVVNCVKPLKSTSFY